MVAEWRELVGYTIAALCAVANGASIPNYLRRLFVMAHSDEGAMTQVPSVRPFYESDLADQFRSDPVELLHFLCG
jgi:hypothetical protein